MCFRDRTFTKALNLWIKFAQSCLTLCDPMDCSLPGSSIHGILQARILEWVAISFSRRSSRPRDWTRVSCIVGRHFTVWATREVLKVLGSAILGFRLPRWLSGKKIRLLTQKHRLNLWVGKIPRRRKWQPTPVFLPGKSHGWKSLAGYSPWGCKRVGQGFVTKTRYLDSALSHFGLVT